MHKMCLALYSRAFHKIKIGVFCSTRIRTSIIRQNYIIYKSKNTIHILLESTCSHILFPMYRLETHFLVLISCGLLYSDVANFMLLALHF